MTDLCASTLTTEKERQWWRQPPAPMTDRTVRPFSRNPLTEKAGPMSYRPGYGRDPYPYPHDGDGYRRDDYPYRDRRRDDGAHTLVTVIRVLTGAIVTIFALHVLFVVFGANQGNALVSLDYVLAKAFVLGFGDVFTPGSAILGVVLNYGLAALVYVVIGQLVIVALRRR